MYCTTDWKCVCVCVCVGVCVYVLYDRLKVCVCRCVCVCVCVSVPVAVPLLPLSFPKPNQLNRESRARSGHFFNKATLHWLGQLPITITGVDPCICSPT